MIKKIKKFIVALALVFTCLLSCLPFGTVQVLAEGINVDGGYTNVLDDLKKDETFNESQYPILENNYKLEVITISESVVKELFVYVYQPNPEHGKYIASSINISATDDNSLDIMNYPLTLVNYDGVYQKYLVTGITLPTSGTRYYEVISIYRVFDETIDEGLSDDNDNTISEVVFKVGKLFTLTDTENGVSVNVNDTEVITVTSKWVGFIRYEAPLNGIMGFTDYYDRHFVAFSTDKKIDKLMEADVFYTHQTYDFKRVNGIKYQDECSDAVPMKAELHNTDTGSYEADNVFWKTEFEWYRISSVDTFLSGIDKSNIYTAGIVDIAEQVVMSEEAMNLLKDKQWILSFTETAYSEKLTTDTYEKHYSIISDVSIMRLKFETDGVIYNLGVVDNKQSGDLVADGVQETKLELSDTFKIIVALLGLILLLIVLGPFLPTIFSLIGFILKWVFKIVTAPIWFIFWLFRRR